MMHGASCTVFLSACAATGSRVRSLGGALLQARMRLEQAGVHIKRV